MVLFNLGLERKQTNTENMDICLLWVFPSVNKWHCNVDLKMAVGGPVQIYTVNLFMQMYSYKYYILLWSFSVNTWHCNVDF